MDSSQQFSLRWNNYTKHITSAFDTLRSDEDLVDVTLSCEGKRIRAHKMLLSACSTYFRDLFKENPCQHPVIIFRNVKFDDLAALVDFMYQGEVNVVQEQLGSFLTTAELLAVQGLTDGTGKDSESINEEEVDIPNEPEVQLQNSSGKYLSNNNKGNKSPLPYHAVDVQPDTPPTKRRKYRETSNNDKSSSTTNSTKGTTTKESKEKSSESAGSNATDPIEIIPLMPSLKLEIPEYLEADGSSCSYDEQNITDGTLNKLDDGLSSIDDDRKPDLSHTFYTNQSSSDIADSKHTSSSSSSAAAAAAAAAVDLDHLLAKPSTSGERLTQEATPVIKKRKRKNNLFDLDARTVVIDQPSHSCKLCGKSFWNRDSMYKHMNMHKGTTQCPVCHKVLSRTTHMKRHLKNRHGWLGFATAATTTNITRNQQNQLSTITSPAATATVIPQQQQQQQNAITTASPDTTFTTIRIRESSVERITSSPIP